MVLRTGGSELPANGDLSTSLQTPRSVQRFRFRHPLVTESMTPPAVSYTLDRLERGESTICFALQALSGYCRQRLIICRERWWIQSSREKRTCQAPGHPSNG